MIPAVISIDFALLFTYKISLSQILKRNSDPNVAANVHSNLEICGVFLRLGYNKTCHGE